MRANVHAGAWGKRRGAHLVEKDEGSDHAALRRRQDTAHLEAAEVARASFDDQLDGGVIAFGAFGALGGLPTHGATLGKVAPERQCRRVHVHATNRSMRRRASLAECVIL